MSSKSIENTEQVRELERAILGGLMLETERYDAVSEIIEFTDFEGQDHQNIFQSMGELVNSNKPLDPLTVSDRLDSKNLLTRAGGKNYLIDLASTSPSAANLEAYAGMVRQKSISRRLMKINSEISELIVNPQGKDAAELLDEAETKIFSLNDEASRTSTNIQKLDELIPQSIERMNEIAEKGYAAHFGYKHKESNKSEVDLWLNRLQEVLNHDNEHAVDFVEDFKLNFYSKEIYVFTPNGDLKSLKSGSSALDFAFHVHTDIGIKTRGSRVNGKLVPLSHTLKSGDQVEIITSENVKPNVNWLNFVETSKAKSKIKSSLNDEKKRISLDGKEILERKLRQLKIKLDDKVSGQMMKFFRINASNDLFYKIGNGSIDNKQIKSFASINESEIEDYGVISIMYHRFDESKYPSTNIQVDVFKKQLEIIQNEK